jgi:hypothetical protein
LLAAAAEARLLPLPTFRSHQAQRLPTLLVPLELRVLPARIMVARAVTLGSTAQTSRPLLSVLKAAGRASAAPAALVALAGLQPAEQALRNILAATVKRVF